MQFIPNTYVCSNELSQALKFLARKFKFTPYENYSEFRDESVELMNHLPPDLIKSIVSVGFNLGTSTFLLIRNLPVETEPEVSNIHWYSEGIVKESYFSEAIMLCIASLLGQVLCFKNEEPCRPIRNLAHGETRKDSIVSEINWHTDLAASACQPDFLTLCCISGSKDATTEFACIGDILKELDAETISELKQNKFIINLPETVHTSSHMNKNPTAILSGNGQSIKVTCCTDYIYFDSSRAKHAYDSFLQAAESVAHKVSLNNGDLLVLDNRRTIHRRSHFSDKFTSRRWLQQLYIKQHQHSLIKAEL